MVFCDVVAVGMRSLPHVNIYTTVWLFSVKFRTSYGSADGLDISPKLVT
jgi:hypothetical protein